GRAEVIEVVVPVEIRIAARTVADADARLLEAPRHGEPQLRKDLERVGKIQPEVLLPGLDVDVGLEVTRAGSSHTAPPAQEVRRAFPLSKARGVSVIGEADGEPVVRTEKLAAVRELQGHAQFLGGGLGVASPPPRVKSQVPGG